MFDRRQFLAAGLSGTTLAAALPGTATAQVWTADGAYGKPAPTYPFSPQVYAARRAALARELDGGVAVLYGATRIDPTETVLMTEGARPIQDMDFAYLTGLHDEPGAAIVLAPAERVRKEELYLPDRSERYERWEGERVSVSRALRERTGFNRILRGSAPDVLLTELAQAHKKLVFLGPLASPNAPVPPALALYQRIAQRVPGTTIVSRPDLIERMRTIKEPRELELMQKAIDATAAGHLAAMRSARPGMSERELVHIIENAFRAAGADHLAFPSITAAGRAGATLHYTGRDGTIGDGDLVLNDIGASYRTYAADITRTFPVSGTFSPAQRAAYEAVLDAQVAAARAMRPGAYFHEVQVVAENSLEAAGYRDDFWHGLGHFVGLDVHDVGDYRAPLPENAVLTIEPGVYRPQENFGIRIEDEFLVTGSGSRRMSEAIPYRPDDVEAAVRSGR
ncbi:aminopeptidase P N-terminal domain-containing protein [Sphingomicrobium arenosum]|uniref:aminopeptidase P N-terminal domain-containing protein n=1 Tax=Sphingomicrobium arenosum TaxID=2233861 RepID=UPI002240D8AD|nr:aminopeptidase P N-terminal domain-containing protein [Sphingomicrobium arenosum]